MNKWVVSRLGAIVVGFLQVLWPLFLLVSLPFCIVLNGCLLEIRKINLEYVFKVWNICCCYCKYCQDETKNSCTVFSIITLSATEGWEWLKKDGWKIKRDDPLSPTGLMTTLPKKPTEERFCFFFLPCHAFNGALFPVGSALEVTPASVPLIFADR